MKQALEGAEEAAGEVGEAMDGLETPGADSESEAEGGAGGMTTDDGTAVATTATEDVKEAGSGGVSPAELIKAEIIENKEVSFSEGLILARQLLLGGFGTPVFLSKSERVS